MGQNRSIEVRDMVRPLFMHWLTNLAASSCLVCWTLQFGRDGCDLGGLWGEGLCRKVILFCLERTDQLTIWVRSLSTYM